MTPTATTTLLLSEATTLINENAPQMILILVGVLTATFIWLLGRKAIKRVFRAFIKL